MKIKSKINPQIDLEYLQTQSEGQYFERKSAKIQKKDLGKHFSAFSNAEGGVLAIGISDNRELEGINFVGDTKLNELINAPWNTLKSPMLYKMEFLDIINKNGEKDQILLFHIYPSYDRLIRTRNDSTYLRIGDKTKEVKGDALIQLEYSRSNRFYEDEINYDATISDLDKELLNLYKEKVGAEKLTDEEVLKARGLIRKADGVNYLTNAAVLLFAKNIAQFYPNCRTRVLRYQGNKAEVGININLNNDLNIECSILNIIQRTIDII